MTKNYTPLGEMLLVEIPEQEEVTEGGLILQGVPKKNDLEEATILSFGSEVETQEVYSGDKVIVSKSQAIELDKERGLYLLRIDRILCKIDEE